MNNLHIIETVLKILCEQPPMAFLGAMLAAQKTVLVQVFGLNLAANLPHINQVQVGVFVFGPGHFLVPVLVEEFFGRGKIEVVLVADAANFT